MAAGVISLGCSNAMARPLKVCILAGQSNMEGHAQVSTIDHIGMDPKTAPMLKDMRNADGTPRVCDDVCAQAGRYSPHNCTEGNFDRTAAPGHPDTRAPRY